MPIDLRKIHYFNAIVDAGSFRRASEQLHVAQPALSKSMRSLEEFLGVPLLIRHSKGIETTEEGAALYNHGVELLAAWREAEADVKDRASEISGTVSIGAPPTLAQHLFGVLCSEVSATYPKLRLELYEGIGHHLWDELHSERLDIAVIGGDEGSDSIITERVMNEDIYALSRAEMNVPLHIASSELLLDYPLIVTTRASTGRSWFEEVTRDSKLAFDVRYRVESPLVAKDLVERGLGLAVLPASGVISEVGNADFQISRVGALELPRVLACRKSRYMHSSVKFIRNLLREQLLGVEIDLDAIGRA